MFKENEIKPGDLLFVKRRRIYNHYAIYFGDNKVIHLARLDEINDYIVHVTNLDNFLRGSKVFYKAIYLMKPNDTSELIIQRALAKIGNRNYNVLFNNCKHFVNWCVYGNRYFNPPVMRIKKIGIAIKKM